MERFRKKVLYITDEEMLKKVKLLLDNYGFKCDDTVGYLHYKDLNYLQFTHYDNCFSMGDKNETEAEITLDEFINLLNQE